MGIREALGYAIAEIEAVNEASYNDPDGAKFLDDIHAQIQRLDQAVGIYRGRAMLFDNRSAVCSPDQIEEAPEDLEPIKLERMHTTWRDQSTPKFAVDWERRAIFYLAPDHHYGGEERWHSYLDCGSVASFSELQPAIANINRILTERGQRSTAAEVKT